MIKTDLRGILTSKRNLNGLFSIAGRKLTDREVRKIAQWAVKKGYQYDVDIPDEQAIEVLGWKNT